MNSPKFPEYSQNTNWEYDPQADVLYVYFNEPKQAEGIDIGNGTIIRIDTTTNEVVGFTIVNPIKRTLDQLELQ